MEQVRVVSMATLSNIQQLSNRFSLLCLCHAVYDHCSQWKDPLITLHAVCAFAAFKDHREYWLLLRLG